MDKTEMNENDFVHRPPFPLVSWESWNIASSEAEEHDAEVTPVLAALSVACHVLRLSSETLFTAACLIHRYYYSIRHYDEHGPEKLQSSGVVGRDDNEKGRKDNNNRRQIRNSRSDDDGQTIPDSRLVLVCCICLACKTEEEPRRLRDFINLSQMLSWDTAHHQKPFTTKTGAASGRDSQQRDTSKITAALAIESEDSNPCFKEETKLKLFWKQDPPDLDETYWMIKENIVTTEQHVLRWLAFDVFVSHPHRAVVAIMQDYERLYGSNRKCIHELANQAFMVLNSVAIFSSRALAIPVILLAVATIQLVDEYYVKSEPPSIEFPFLRLDETNRAVVKAAKQDLRRVIVQLSTTERFPTDGNKRLNTSET